MVLSFAAQAATGAGDEGPTFLNGFWKGRGGVNRDGGVAQCYYVMTQFKVAKNVYENVLFKRKCYTPDGQKIVDAKGSQSATSADVNTEIIPGVKVDAKNGQLLAGDTVVGSYTSDTVEVRYEMPSPENPKDTYIWHGKFTLIGKTLVCQEDAVTLAPDKSVKVYNIIYSGVMEPAQGSESNLTKELNDPN
jgi:hypothetical protein